MTDTTIQKILAIEVLLNEVLGEIGEFDKQKLIEVFKNIIEDLEREGIVCH